MTGEAIVVLHRTTRHDSDWFCLVLTGYTYMCNDVPKCKHEMSISTEIALTPEIKQLEKLEQL